MAARQRQRARALWTLADSPTKAARCGDRATASKMGQDQRIPQQKGGEGRGQEGQAQRMHSVVWPNTHVTTRIVVENNTLCVWGQCMHMYVCVTWTDVVNSQEPRML